MSARFDILGIGCVAVDDLVYIDAFPQADAKMRVKRRERQFGGLTGTALVAAAKLGGQCAFAGLLGDDEFSRMVEANFVAYGIDVSGVIRKEGASPVHSVIIVAEQGHSRNIFFDDSAPTGADPSGPNEQMIRDSKVLFLDYIGVEGGIRAAKIARQAGIPIVADLEDNNEPDFDNLVGLVDHLVLCEEFAERITGKTHPSECAEALMCPGRDTVVITSGARGATFLTFDEPAPRRQPAYAVDVVDTTGCGDVFHGAYALALARGHTAEERVRFATAAASLKAKKPGGQLGAPTWAELDRFLSEQ